MKVFDISGELARSKAGPPTIPRQRRQRIMLHHSKGRGSPWGLADYCVNDRGWDCHPYTFHDHDGQLYQTAPLNAVTPHAVTTGPLASSPFAYGIVITGNFDERSPPRDAVHRIARLCAYLRELHGWGLASTYVEAPKGVIALRVAGHNEVPWSSRKIDPNGIVIKTCPGDRFSMAGFRTLVSEYIRTLPADLDIRSRMEEIGITIPKEKSWKV